MDLDKAINNVSFSNDKNIEKNKVHQKKRFGTAYVEEVNNKYKIILIILLLFIKKESFESHLVGIMILSKNYTKDI